MKMKLSIIFSLFLFSSLYCGEMSDSFHSIYAGMNSEKVRPFLSRVSSLEIFSLFMKEKDSDIRRRLTGAIWDFVDYYDCICLVESYFNGNKAVIRSDDEAFSLLRVGSRRWYARKVIVEKSLGGRMPELSGAFLFVYEEMMKVNTDKECFDFIEKYSEQKL